MVAGPGNNKAEVSIEKHKIIDKNLEKFTCTFETVSDFSSSVSSLLSSRAQCQAPTSDHEVKITSVSFVLH